MKYSGFLLISLIVISCHPDKNLERRVNALERRVAALEKQANLSGKNTADETAVGVADSVNHNDSTQDNIPEFRFEETDFNFGTINEGDMVDHNFKFTNVGNAPLIINRASASCGCTVPSPPKDPILPGQSSQIHVRFNSNNKQNQQVKTITIEANTNPSITKLQIHGFVIPRKQANSSF